MAQVMPPTPEALCQAVAIQHEISVAELMDMDCTHARPARSDAWSRLREMEEVDGRPRYTFNQIAQWWGVKRNVVSQSVYRRRDRMVRR